VSYVIIAYQPNPTDQFEELESMNGRRNPDVLFCDEIREVQDVLDEYGIEDDGRKFLVGEFNCLFNELDDSTWAEKVMTTGTEVQ